jgi:hypothetical protein
VADDLGKEFRQPRGGVLQQAHTQGHRDAAELAVEGLVTARRGGAVAAKMGLPSGAGVGQGVEEPADEMREGDDALVGSSAVAVEESGQSRGIKVVAEERQGGLGEGQPLKEVRGVLGRGRYASDPSLGYKSHGGFLAVWRSS